MNRRYWRIRGYHRLDPIFDETVKSGSSATIRFNIC